MMAISRTRAGFLLLLAPLFGPAQAGTDTEQLTQAKQAVRCAIITMASANLLPDQGHQELTRGAARRLASHAIRLGATDAMGIEWTAQLQKELVDAYPEGDSRTAPVPDNRILAREGPICERLSSELLDAMFKEVEAQSKVPSQ